MNDCDNRYQVPCSSNCFVGSRCSSCVGTQGPQGPQGPIGPQGIAGFTGPAGAQGIAGPAGVQGVAGPVGPQGIAGTAGPQGLAGPAGVQGVAGPAGAQGPAGVNGLSEYAYIYNLAAQVVALEADILFSTNGLIVGAITHVAGTSSITIGTAGNYAVWFNETGVEPNQFTLYQNGAAVAGSTYGSGAGTQGNMGMVIISAAAGDVLTVRNHTSAAAVTLQTLAGGTVINANASILIQKISP